MADNLLVLSPCGWTLKPGTLCGQLPAGVDLKRGVCLCAEHFKVLQGRTALPPLVDIIDGVYEWLRLTWHPPYEQADS